MQKKIKDSLIQIRDVERGEKMIEIRGPKVVESEGHKLVLCQSPESEKEVEENESSSDESENQGSDDDDDDEGDWSGIFNENEMGKYKENEVPIAYDSFTFSKSQRNYGTYKKELCAIVEFARRYEHMLRGTEPSVILTDQKPLTYFLSSSILDGIYAR